MSNSVAAFRNLAQFDRQSAEYRRLRDSLIKECLPIADAVARRFVSRGESLDDLIQVARSGLVTAVDRFDPERGSQFVSFAVPTITGTVLRHFRDNTWPVNVPRGLKDLRTRIGPASDALAQRLGHSPRTAELAGELGVRELDVRRALTSGRAYRTSPLYGSSAVSGDLIADTFGDIDLRLEQVDNWEMLRPLLIELPERERAVLLLRYFSLLTQQEIASAVGVSQMQVCRLLTKALAHLRSQLEVAESATG